VLVNSWQKAKTQNDYVGQKMIYASVKESADGGVHHHEVLVGFANNS